MKKIALWLGIFMILFASQSWAAGTVTISKDIIGVGTDREARIILTVTWTAGTSGALTDATINATTYGLHGYYLISSETLSGATAPTNGYVTNIKTASGGTLFTMTGSNSTTVSVLTNYQYVTPIMGDLTFNVTGNSVTSSTAICKLIFTRN